MNQSPFSSSDLLTNDKFIAWVQSPTPELNNYWQQWLQRNPYREEELSEARELLLALRTDKEVFPQAEKQQLFEKLSAHSQGRSYSQINRPKVRSVNYWRPIGVAASVIIAALFVGLLIWSSQPNQMIIATQYGETQEFTLPDGTEVFLNANSTLRYSTEDTPREVWLEGEAYFQVVKQKNGLTQDLDDFKVHTRNLTVRVLGTRFVVDSRKEQVVLDEGKVEVQPRANDQTNLSLVPGEMAVLNQETKQIKVSQVNPYEYIAWKDNQLIFNETPLYEIAQLLQDRYGYEVKFKTPATRLETFNGTFPANDLQILFRTLEKSISLEVNEKTILINE
ncbi:FecR family protein [Tunicatimonas pelagia]|uniref:FecR family protein n=1 Tax=Tunicatimonas pelagia TaxID=931531 RepID=UPI0026667307|nr:FecR domain-containing protein [Tunicatimonas pelagia]WKN42362.1 FecR domain-containing protein [Tunicatimonas pelagia]